ncbi:MAG: DUF721 domain-containing protein [Solirubrobacterales bacterium]
MGRPAPRHASASLRAARERAAPRTPLAALQSVWSELVGTAIAAAAGPVSERDGVVVVACESAVWAQELEMMAAELHRRVEARLGDGAPSALRFVVRGSEPI